MDISFDEVLSRDQIEARRAVDRRVVKDKSEAFFTFSRATVEPSTRTTASPVGGRLRLHVLASGSRGNATIIEDAVTGEGILVDCGICKRDFFARCDEAGFDPAKLAAILVTHDHTDHTKGLGVVLRGLAKQGTVSAVYADGAVRAESSEICALEGSHDVRSLDIGGMLSLAGLSVHPFRTSHDAASSCGFRIEAADGDAVGFMTDTGVVTGEAHEALLDVRLLALESNHDVQMLADGPYPYPVKRRVGSDFGHLSNVQAADELALLLGNRLEQVVAMHISQNNNTYRMPGDALSGVVEREGHGACVRVAYQSRLVSVR